ncbi:MAG: hypothetical protein FD123_2733 [Bacteroidetes bacterium]|nr:MAG: hypothetical protein FD123_2733 [Bacteroidota bacterium]
MRKRTKLAIKLTLQHFRSYLLIALGICSAGFGLKSFLLPNGFIDGGVTGISLLVSSLTDFSLSWLILLINLPFFWIAYTQVSKIFSLKTLAAVICLALVLALVSFPVITQDKVLVAVFGGFFVGMGIGLSIRGGAVIDGTEVLALYINRKTGLSIGDIILLINVVIFINAAFLLDVETALYSILAYLAASKTVDFIVNGIEEYTGVTIVSARSEKIRQVIIHQMGHGVTIYKAKSGYGKKGQSGDDIDVIYTVITRLEISRLKAEIDRIDPDAFVTMNSLNDIKGGIVKKRTITD